MDPSDFNRLSRILRRNNRSALKNLLLRSASTRHQPANGGPDLYELPVGINQAASHVWRDVITTRRAKLYNSKDAGTQWSRAIVEFVTACEKKRIEPYEKGATRSVAVNRKLKIASRTLDTNVWLATRVIKDFHNPRIEMIGRRGRQATITVDLRLAPCITASFSNAENRSVRRTFGRGTVDEVNLDSVLAQALNWLNKER